MANYQMPLNPDHANYNKFLFAQLNNGSPDGRDDSLLGWRLYRVVCTVSDTGVLTVAAPSLSGASDTVALAAATSQEIDLHTALDSYLFPSDVMRGQAYIRRLVAFDSVTTPTAAIGDTTDPDELLTATAIDATGLASTPAAAAYASQVEAAFIPTLTLAAGVGNNFDTVTAGSLEIGIMYAPIPY